MREVGHLQQEQAGREPEKLGRARGGGFRFGVGEWRGLLVRDALVSALVCVCVAVSWWSRVWLVCFLWLSWVFCLAAFGCNAVTFDFV